jgi:hypothetical protein
MAQQCRADPARPELGARSLMLRSAPGHVETIRRNRMAELLVGEYGPLLPVGFLQTALGVSPDLLRLSVAIGCEEKSTSMVTIRRRGDRGIARGR